TLRATILPPQGEVASDEGLLRVRIDNRSNTPITILHPLDGSEDCWLMPFYRLTLLDDRGHPVARDHVRCNMFGLWANMNWPNDYRITLQPGQSFEHQARLAHRVPKDGRYRAMFE